MSAAEKRLRAHFAHYKGEGGFIRSITTGKGSFPLNVADIKYVMGERRRTSREISRAVSEALPGTKTARIVADICKQIGAK